MQRSVQTQAFPNPLELLIGDLRRLASRLRDRDHLDHVPWGYPHECEDKQRNHDGRQYTKN